jgi:chlorite dismutase
MTDARARLEPPDISEKGGLKGGQPQRSDERLFVQLLVYTGCDDVRAVASWIARAPVDAVVYEDLNDPRGIAVLTLGRDPNIFLDVVRPTLAEGPLSALAMKPDLTMFGRTYSLGYEPDLRSALIDRPRRTALNPDWRWAIWYPLRRHGRFAQLPPEEQRTILAEHGEIGMRFGAADYVHDIRLACHGLDRDDNDFVIGLTGKDLYPLSAVVQVMRKTQQTSLYLERLGPFFVGRVVWQSPVERGLE